MLIQIFLRWRFPLAMLWHNFMFMTESFLASFISAVRTWWVSASSYVTNPCTYTHRTALLQLYSLIFFLLSSNVTFFTIKGLGVPFNIASYSLLTVMIAHVCGLKPGDFVHTIGDAHIYLNHIEALKEQVRQLRSCFWSPPFLTPCPLLYWLWYLQVNLPLPTFF